MPTDTHQYPHSCSCLPYHCKQRISRSQTLRLNRNCSDSVSLIGDVRTRKDGYWKEARKGSAQTSTEKHNNLQS